MKSIMHQKDGTCYLCMKFNKEFSPKNIIHEHHAIFGCYSSGRHLSEIYGLKVYLCLEHHLYGKDAVHQNKSVKEYLCKEAQKCFEKNYPNLSFMEIFGKNYLDDADRVESTNRQHLEDGFIPISDGLEGLEW